MQRILETGLKPFVALFGYLIFSLEMQRILETGLKRSLETNQSDSNSALEMQRILETGLKPAYPHTTHSS